MLDKIFKGKKDSKTVAKKVVLEQLTSSPWNNMFFMIYYGLVIEGRPWNQVKSKIEKEYPTVQYTAWTVWESLYYHLPFTSLSGFQTLILGCIKLMKQFWPVVGWVNHQYVPLQFRVIVQSVVACFWAIFLNLRARSMALTK